MLWLWLWLWGVLKMCCGVLVVVNVGGDGGVE